MGWVAILNQPMITQTQRRRRKLRSFAMQLPRAAQLAMLKLPALQSRLSAERREIVVQVANTLIANGISHNRSAAILHVASSTLCSWRQSYAKNGFDGLVPKTRGQRGRRAGSAEGSPCRL